MSDVRSTEEQIKPDDAGSTAGGTMRGYAVEARHDSSTGPLQVGSLVFDSRWRRVRFEESLIGVPRGSRYESPMLDATHLYSYASAQALRWWLHASADGVGGICLASRIVQFEIEYSHKWKAISYHEHINGEDRSNLMPDWGTK